MYGSQRAYPSPYDYPSADDYYQAVEDYNQWLKDKEEADAEAADRAYEDKVFAECVRKENHDLRKRSNPACGCKE